MRDATFNAPGVDAGVKGLLYTRRAKDGALLSAATAVVHVGAHPLAGIRMEAKRPASISGRFVFARPYEPVQHALDPQVYLHADGPDAWLRDNLFEGSHERPTLEKHEFRRTGIFGRYRIDARAPTGWVVNGVILDDGRNILDTTFEFEPGKHYANLRVLLSPNSATIEGLVRQPRRDPAALDVVLLFPVDDNVRGVQRYRHEVSLKADGSFLIPTVTPGREYYVTTCQWPCTNPEDLEDRIKRAARIFIDRPGVFTVTLKR